MADKNHLQYQRTIIFLLLQKGDSKMKKHVDADCTFLDTKWDITGVRNNSGR